MEQKTLWNFCRCFRQKRPSLLKKLQEAAKENDAQELARVAHQLSGLSSSIAADKLHKLSLDMETAAKRSDWDSIRQGQPNLEGCMTETREFVGHVLANSSSYLDTNGQDSPAQIEPV